VYLVGAGPGDPDLLTLRARDLLASCDAVLYDHLANPDLLDHCPPGAERRYTGKVGHGPQHSQRAIEAALIDRARRRLRVVRLKGGDPLLFGRGGEEAAALAAAGIPFEIVPGVSSALAAPVYAGIPLTHRGTASSVAFVTGHCATGDGRAVRDAAGADTVVVLMGLARLPEIAAELMAAGRSGTTAAAVIERGTYANQRVIVATLATLVAAVARERPAAPAIVVVGDVVRLRDSLAWFVRERLVEATSL
jgi:uroporphyrin-III C-methyltransferase